MMAIVSTKARGLDALRAHFRVLPDAARMGAGEGLQATAEAAAQELKATLPDRARRSAPGEPPDDPRGRIAAAVTARLSDDRASAKVTVALPFARDLEFGTRKMAARPFLRPAALRAGDSAKALLAKTLTSILKGSSR